MRITHFFWQLITLFLLALPAHALEPFTAHYDVYYGKIYVGKSVVTLQKQEDRYQLSRQAKTTGIAALLYNANTYETSDFTLNEGLQSQKYVYQETGKQTKQYELDFNGSEHHYDLLNLPYALGYDWQRLTGLKERYVLERKDHVDTLRFQTKELGNGLIEAHWVHPDLTYKVIINPNSSALAVQIEFAKKNRTPRILKLRQPKSQEFLPD